MSPTDCAGPPGSVEGRGESLRVVIEAPSPDADPVELGGAISFVGRAEDDDYGAETLSAQWASSRDGVLFEAPVGAGGEAVWVTDTLSEGWHTVSLTVTNPSGYTAVAELAVGVCTWDWPGATFGTDLQSDAWRVFGDAYWDPGGWLEMTGNAQNRKGAIFNVANRVGGGDVAIAFRLWTGGGTGADGFAMSVLGARDVVHLETVVAASAAGGGLGYGYGGGYGDLEVPGFHIEVDTWENRIVPNGDPFDDPTPENHLAVTLNGDPGNHVLWSPIANIEDQAWHDVTVEIVGFDVRVSLDGEEKVQGTLNGFRFKGGFIGFSGTTGYYTNHHRFDDLRVMQRCIVH